MSIIGRGVGGPDPRTVPYRGSLKPGDWVEYNASFPRSDGFFEVPVGLEFIEGSLAQIVNLRGDVARINAEALKRCSDDNPMMRMLPACNLTSVPGLGAIVELVSRSMLSEKIQEVFQDGGATIVALKPGHSNLLATVRNERGAKCELGLGHLKRADLPQQIASLLQRQNQELCAGQAVGTAGNAVLVGGVRLAMRH